LDKVEYDRVGLRFCHIDYMLYR